jgi:hypothetical protein
MISTLFERRSGEGNGPKFGPLCGTPNYCETQDGSPEAPVERCIRVTRARFDDLESACNSLGLLPRRVRGTDVLQHHRNAL